MRDILTRHDDLIIVGTTPTGTGMDEIYYVGKTSLSCTDTTEGQQP